MSKILKVLYENWTKFNKSRHSEKKQTVKKIVKKNLLGVFN